MSFIEKRKQGKFETHTKNLKKQNHILIISVAKTLGALAVQTLSRII